MASTMTSAAASKSCGAPRAWKPNARSGDAASVSDGRFTWRIQLVTHLSTFSIIGALLRICSFSHTAMSNWSTCGPASYSIARHWVRRAGSTLTL